MKITMKGVVEFEYQTDSEYYPTDDQQEWAKIDENNFNDDPGSFIELLDGQEWTVKVTPKK